jgi:rhodanese-related sulfurtransferase
MKKQHIKYLFIVNLIFVLLSCTAQTSTVLLSNQFEQAITNNDSAQILDVRTDEEYNTGHIKGALLANWNNTTEFNRRIAFINKQKPVYIYCLAGGRSEAAAKTMRALGFTNVYELKGGINAWKANNKPLEAANTTEQLGLEKFNQLINKYPVVLVDVGATWCPPCKMMEPILTEFLSKHAAACPIIKIDAATETSILKAYNITALPVFIVFKNGVQTWRKDGVVTLTELEATF